MTKAQIHIVGTGPGSLDYITPAAKKIVQVADIIIGAQRSLNLFQDDIHGESVTLTAKNLNGVLQYAAESTQKGKVVVLLSTGDPGFSGLLQTFLNTVACYDVTVNVVPGISSIQVCAARLGLCWDNISLFTFHDIVTDKKKAQLAQLTKSGKTVMLFPNPKNFTPQDAANFLIASGLTKNTPVFICENLTLSDEKIVKTTLEQASKQTFSSLCIMVIQSENSKISNS